MGDERPQQFDVGTVFRLQVVKRDVVDPELLVPVDLTGATLAEFIFDPPGSSPFVRPATLAVAAQGILEYSSVAGDLRWAGGWRWQAHVVKGSTDLRTRAVSFDVEPNLQPPPQFLAFGVVGLSPYLPAITLA